MSQPESDPNEQANISGADFAIMCDELKTLRAELTAKKKALSSAKIALDAKDRSYSVIEQRFSAMAAKAATTDSERECNERLTAEIDALTAELTEARRQLKEASEQEPEEWRCISPGGTTTRRLQRPAMEVHKAQGWTCIPLYAAPVPQPADDFRTRLIALCQQWTPSNLDRIESCEEIIREVAEGPHSQPAVPEALIKEAATYLDHFGRADLASELRAILATKEGKKDGL